MALPRESGSSERTGPPRPHRGDHSAGIVERPARIRLVRTAGRRSFETRIAGTGPEVLLAVPGGPGCSFDYLSPLLRLADDGLRVLLMNPRGVGRSWSPRNAEAFTIRNLAQDVERLRRSVAARRFHLLGYSAGGMVALEYAMLYPDRLGSLILCSTAASISEVRRAYRRVLASAPETLQRRLKEFELTKEFDNPAYRALVSEINRPYTSRFAAPCCDMLRGLPTNRVYRTMFTPTGDEYVIDGTAARWSRVRNLPEIGVPTLVLTGEYDFLRGASEGIAARVPGACLRVIPRSSHMSVQEQPDDFVRTVSTFLKGTRQIAVPHCAKRWS